jgi:hypothetical protein
MFLTLETSRTSMVVADRVEEEPYSSLG